MTRQTDLINPDIFQQHHGLSDRLTPAAYFKWLPLLLCVLLLCSCGHTKKSKGGGYYQNDGPGGVTVLSAEQLKDAVPRVDPLLSGPNKPYKVNGKNYAPDTREISYKKRGHASWYGKQFHGRKTSSGEVYDMYGMTAAHTTLPIPCYVRVTNVANKKTVIVRVNDRGPFHSSRIIDLSYAAAYKLGYINQGTAEVIVERIMPDDIRSGTVASMDSTPSTSGSPGSASNQSSDTGRWDAQKISDGYYLQVAAFSSYSRAQSVLDDLTQSVDGIDTIVEIQSDGGYHRIFVGPFGQEYNARQVARKIKAHIGEEPLLLDRR